MRIKRRLQDIPDGDPVPGASMTVSRATDGGSVGSVLTDAEGWAELTFNGSPGPVKTRFQKGQNFWQDDSRAIMPTGSAEMVQLRDLINFTHSDGVLPYGAQFAATGSGGQTLVVQPGAVVLDGVLAVWYTTTFTFFFFAGSEGDRAIVAKQMHADGRTELVEVDYATIGSLTGVPLWRFTRALTSGNISNLTWIGVRSLIGITSRRPCQASIVRLASGSTTHVTGEASGLATTITLENGVTYDITAKASVISRGRAGAIAIEIDGNLSAYRANGADDDLTIKNSHSRTVVGTGAAITVRVFDRSDTLLTDWVLQLTEGQFGTGNDDFNTPAQLAVDPSGNVYIADTGNNRLIKRDSSGVYVAQITGLTGITGVAIDSSGNIYVVYGSSKLRKYNSSHVQQWDQPFASPFLTHLATDGSHVYATRNNNTVGKYLCSTGAFVTSWGSTGTGNSQFNTPWGIAVGGGEVYVVDKGNSRAQVFTTAGVYVRQFAIPANGRGIALDDSGDVWIAINGANVLYRYSNAGVFQTSIPQASPDGVDLASGDVLWVSNVTSHNIAKWDEAAASFNWDAGLLSVVAIPRT